MRLDPRLTWDDIDMRMEYVGARASHNNTIDMASNDVTKQAGKAKNRFTNALQTRCSRGRAAFNMLSWRERTRIFLANKTRDHVLNRLSAEQIANNTTRGSTPGIINPLLPDTPANRVSHRGTQIQRYTPQPPPVLAPHSHAQISSTDAATLPRLHMHQAAPPNLGQPLVPPTVPSTQASRKRKAKTASPPAPTAINDTCAVDEKPLNLRDKQAKMTLIDLTQDDERDSDPESFAGNHAATWDPSADRYTHVSQPSLIRPDNVLETQLNWSPNDILRRTPSLSGSFPLDPAPTPLTSTTIPQPPSGAEAPKEEESAAVIDPNWGREMEHYYHNDHFAPFTDKEIGQGYLGWGPNPSDPSHYPF